MYKIEKGVPKPSPVDLSKYKYPFRQMDVGDSFKFGIGERFKVASSMHKYSKGKPWKFEIQGDRCWRIK